jgi:primosomal protein N' (replication factor Y) (superfamily II helicase)
MSPSVTDLPATLKIALPVPVPGLFDYLPPVGAAIGADWIGCRVEVPFGTRQLIGWVSAIGDADTPPESLKQVIRRIDPEAIVSQELLGSLRWTAQYYQAPLGEVLATAVPALVREGKSLPDVCHYAWRLTDAGRKLLPSLRKNSRALQLAGQLQSQSRDEAWLDDQVPQWRSAMKALSGKAMVERVALSRSTTKRALQPGPELNAEQRQCLADILQSPDFAVHLLEGVTGSGKTEIYIRAIERCLAQNKQALVLVPEIGLTPQTLARFSERLPVPVHVLHSGLSDGARARAWAAMASGSGRVMIGTRSAVFASLPEAGLIIIDEEHDSSYKQQDGFHYHARDLAIVRAKALNVPIILGSATPALESLHNAELGRYHLHRLHGRAGSAKPPGVRLVDVRKIKLLHGLSQDMLDGIRHCLEKGEQALIFKNRRGYAPALLCHDCGFTAMCTRCDSALTLHAGQKRLVCHHCGYQKQKPLACPDCGSLALQPQGFGTERLEETLQMAFPDVPCVRVDSQSTRKKDGLQQQLNQLGQHPGILVGTQILAKGHDLPMLSFVGVVGVDEGLYSADFRAPEKLAQLLVQVSGRAGRSTRAGSVLIQTHHPDHPLLHELLQGGYRQFARSALAERKLAELPPYAYMALIRCESVHSEAAQAFLQDVAGILKAHIKQGGMQMHSSGAIPAAMPKRAGKSRWQLALSATSRTELQLLLAQSLGELHQLKSARKARWSVDVDPTDFM